MDIRTVANPSGISTHRSCSVTQELYFLVAKLLGEGPCRNAYEALRGELETHGLLPKRLDWLGNEHEQTYDEVCRRYSHIGTGHLLEMCRRLGPLVDKEVPNSVRGVRSLLGAGRQSLLRRKEDVARKLTREDYIVRQNHRPRILPINLVQVPNQVLLVGGRELTGSIDHRNAAPSKHFSRTQLFCRTLGHLSAVYCVLFDRTGQFIFTGADDLLVKVWSAITGRLLATLRGASAEIADLAVSHDNTLLAAGSCDKIVRVWCLRTTAPIAVLTGHGGTITSINFCPDDRRHIRYLASTSSDGSVSFWEYIVEQGQTPKFLPKPHKFHEKMRACASQMLCASFSPGGAFLATGCADHNVRVYAMFGQEGPERILEKEAHSDRVDSIQWANSGLRFISGSKDGSAVIWRYENQEWSTVRLRMSARLEGSNYNPPEDSKLKVTMVTWSRDDRWLITAVSDFSIKIWDSTTGALAKELRKHKGETFVLEPHPYDAEILLSAGHDGYLIVWDLTKAEPLASFHNFIEGQGHGAVFDAKWNPAGTAIAATDSHGHLSIYGIVPNNNFKKLPKAMFFHTDYRPLIRDAHHHVLDEQTQLAPHLMPPPFLVDSEGNPYPPLLQRLVPGREHLKDDQLVPTVVVNANGEPEILGGPEALAPAPEGAAVQMPPPPAPVAQPTRSNIDQMIAQLAQQQERQRNRPRSTSSSSNPGASVPTVSSPPPSSDHVYSSRAPPPPPQPRASVSNAQPAAVPNEGERNDGIQQLSTEATASESLPGYRRKIVVKPLTPGQLVSCRSYREACAEEEIRYFYEEVQRRSPNMFTNSTSSPGVTALLAARSRGVGDEGWAPSRPGNSRPTRPTPRQRDSVTTPSRSRHPPVSPGRRASTRGEQPSSAQHGYGTRRSNRHSDRQEERGRRGSRRLAQRGDSSDDEDEEVDVEGRSSRRASDSEHDEDAPRTRARRRPQRSGENSSTSESDESESELASDLLDSDDSDSEAQASSSSSSSEYSDWTAEAGVNLEPPRRARRKVYRRPVLPPSEDDDEQPAPSTSAPSAPQDAADGAATAADQPAAPPSATKKKKAAGAKGGPGSLDAIPEIFRPSEWLAELIPKKSPFYPQMGDEVIYFRQGHELYVEEVKKKAVYVINEKSLPWVNHNIREQELVKVIGIKYEIKPPRLCCLKLNLMDPATGALTNESFTIKYHDMANVLDFLVLRQTYEAAIERNWRPGDRFRALIDDLWWEGELESQEPLNADLPHSMFQCYRVRWPNGDEDRMSPWDLERIDPDRLAPESGVGVHITPEETANILYRPKPEDWAPGGDRDAECNRIADALSQIMSLAIAEPFVAPVDLNMYPTYALTVPYPLDLSTIKARLENRFYRRVTAVQFDVRFIQGNASAFNDPSADIVKNAKIISELCLEVISDQKATDAMTIYHQITERYKANQADDAGPSSSRPRRNGTAAPSSATNTPSLRSRSRKSSPNVDSDSDGPSTKKSETNKSKEKRLTTHLAAAVALSWKHQCKELLDMMWSMEDAVPFRVPVNLRDFPDYTRYVDHPMDLQTIREQLQVGNYSSPNDFAKDVRLIFENSKNYNTNKKSRIYAMTIRLSAKFEERFDAVLASYKKRHSAHAKNGKDGKSAKSGKGKALAKPSHSSRARDSARGQANGDNDKDGLKMVLSRSSRGQMAVQPGPANGEANYGSARRRILEDDDEEPPRVVNGVNGHHREAPDAKPGPSGLSSQPVAATNGKTGKKRRLEASESEDGETEEELETDEEEVEEEMGEEEESEEEENSRSSRKGKALKRPDAAPSAIQAEDESEDEIPISQRRRAPAARSVMRDELLRPSSTTSNSSSASSHNNTSSNSGSVSGDNSLRRSGRIRRKPKRPFESSEEEQPAGGGDAAHERKTKSAVKTRSAGKRTVRYREDEASDDDAAAKRGSSLQVRNRSSGRTSTGGRSQRLVSDEDDENEDPRAKRQPNGAVKRHSSRQSAHEAAKRMRTDLDSSDNDDDADDAGVAVPTNSVSSRGRIRKVVQYSTQEYFE